jgi:hypothetical protein
MPLGTRTFGAARFADRQMAAGGAGGMLRTVSAPGRLSPTLEQVRELLFPNLSAEEGRARITAALASAADKQTQQRVERLAAEGDLVAELLAEAYRRKNE